MAESYVVSSLAVWIERKKKMAKVHFSAHLGSVCRRQFRRVTVAVLYVKSLVMQEGKRGQGHSQEF